MAQNGFQYCSCALCEIQIIDLMYNCCLLQQENPQSIQLQGQITTDSLDHMTICEMCEDVGA